MRRERGRSTVAVLAAALVVVGLLGVLFVFVVSFPGPGACACSPPPPLEVTVTPDGEVTAWAGADAFTAGAVVFSYGSTNVTWATLADVPPDHRLTEGDRVRLYGLAPGTTVRVVVDQSGERYVYTRVQVPTSSPTPSTA